MTEHLIVHLLLAWALVQPTPLQDQVVPEPPPPEPVVLVKKVAKPAWREARVSWYESGHTTANGERYNPDGLTCAHLTMRFGTRIEFRYNGRVVTCRVQDRGPFIRGRTFDLSRGAMRKLGGLNKGVIVLEYRILK